MKLDPIYVESARDVDQIFTEMLPYFEGKEAESNWMHREQSALKIRRITRGNAPEDFLPHYTAGIKHLLDGLVKGCTSLRTTLSTSTCHCVQDISRQLKQGLDPMVEVCCPLPALQRWNLDPSIDTCLCGQLRNPDET